MANKELKSIKFPGLADTYTVNSMPDGASANQQLATDKEGVVKWEEKPFYSTEILHITLSFGGTPFVLYKVSSEVPDVGKLTVGDTVRLWEFYSGRNVDGKIIMIVNGIYVVTSGMCIYVTEDNSSADIQGITVSFPERGVYFAAVEGATKIIGASLENLDKPEISWDGNVEKIKTIDAKYIPEIIAEELPEIPAEKLPEIPAEKLPSFLFSKIPRPRTFEGSFDKVTEGRDTFEFNAYDYYKISEFSPSREDVISFSGTRENGDVYPEITEGKNCCGYGLFIVVYQAGQCELPVSGTTTSYSFNAPSAGLYAKYRSDNVFQTAGTYNFTYKTIDYVIQSSTTFKRYYLDVDDSGTLRAIEV